MDEFNENIFNDNLDKSADEIRKYVDRDDLSAEDLQTLFELTQKGKGVVAKYMRENKTAVWQKDLDDAMEQFATFEQNATPAQAKQIHSLQENIQKAIDANSDKAEKYLEELHKILMQIMLSNDEVFILIFKIMVDSPQDFSNPVLYRQLVAQGLECVQNNDMNGLRNVVARLSQIKIQREGSQLDDMLKGSGITK